MPPSTSSGQVAAIILIDSSTGSTALTTGALGMTNTPKRADTQACPYGMKRGMTNVTGQGHRAGTRPGQTQGQGRHKTCPYEVV